MSYNNILITGGLGYVGGRIAQYLKEVEPATRIFLTTRNCNLDLPEWTDNFVVCQMNLDESDTIKSCLGDIDVIIHLASVNEIESMKFPERALDVNIKGTYRLLNIAKEYNVSRFIYFSTCHVYGDISSSHITEKTPANPYHPYAFTHHAAEDIVRYFGHYHGIDHLILRLSNGYGYPMDIHVNRWSLVFNDLCKQAVTKNKIVLKSSGNQYRDFITLHDIARAVHHLLFNVSEEWDDGLFNLGGENSMTILDVANKIVDIYSKKYNRKEIEIERPESYEDSNYTTPLKYNIDKIKDTNFMLTGKMDLEIEKTMELCEKFILNLGSA